MPTGHPVLRAFCSYASVLCTEYVYVYVGAKKKNNNFVSVFCLRHYISGSTFFAHLLGERVYNI